jgi:hypothetical protein
MVKQRYRSIEVNLLPDSAVSFSRLYRPYILAASGFVILLLILLVTSLIANSSNNANEEKIAEIETEISNLQAKISESNVLGSVSDYVELPRQIRNTQPSMDDLYSDFNQLLTDGMNVQTFEVDGSERIRFNAAFATTEILISFLNNVKQSTTFELVSSSGYNNVPTVSDVTNAQSVNKFAPLTQVSFDLLYIESSSNEGGGIK